MLTRHGTAVTARTSALVPARRRALRIGPLALVASACFPTAGWALATDDHAGSDAMTALHGTYAQLILATLSLAAVAALSLVYHASRPRNQGLSAPVLGLHLKITHMLPAAIQVAIYGYWALYWRQLPSLLPMIGLQLVWAFALDALLAVWRTGRWVVRAGPVPIVLSANLVALFAPVSWPLAIAMISLALLSRDFIRHQGKHVFNPSAFGVSAIGLLNLIWPSLGYSDRAHQFDLAPSMTEVVVLLALIVQLRLPVVLSTLGAGLALNTLALMGLHVLSPSWAPVTLILLLFLTDPATIPRSPLGRLLFGLLAGALMGLIGHGLETLNYSDFYAKVVAVPLANLASPALERCAAGLTVRLPRLQRALSPRLNRVHIALWLALVAMGLSDGVKAERLAPRRVAMHRENRTPFLVVTPAGRTPCRANPLYCQPLRLDLELGCWAAELVDASARRCAGPPGLRGLD